MRLEFHADESGTDGRELTVAGYLFEAERFSDFCDQWNSVLDEFNVPFFHMVDCAHRNRDFAHLSKIEATKLQMKVMRLIKRFTINGFVCNITKSPHENHGISYSEAIEHMINSVVTWAKKTSFGGEVSFFFEAGANGQGLADEKLGLIGANLNRTLRGFYACHAFLPKRGNPGVQAADLLAWQYQNFTKKRAKKQLALLDFRALLRHPHLVIDQCGDPPRLSGVQSVQQSRERIETVHYLPSVSEEEARTGPILILTENSDGPFFTKKSPSQIVKVLACPKCLRALAELHSSNIIQGFYLQCKCENYCAIPDIFPPFAQPLSGFSLSRSNQLIHPNR